MMKNFGEVITAMVTPFNAALEVDYPQARRLARYLVANGSEALLLSGTTGESPNLSDSEKLKLLAEIKAEVGAEIPVIAGVGTNNTSKSLELIKQAEQAGADAALVVAPYYNKPPQEGLLRHFEAVASHTRLPVIIYNIPGRTGVNIAPDTIARLSDIDNIVGVKEASGNLEQMAEIQLKVSRRSKAFLLYSGDDALTLPILSLGGFGVISVASHLAGKLIKRMITEFKAGKVAQARDLHLKLMPLFKALFLTTNPIMVKAALNLRQMDVGGLRPPLVPATPEQEAVLAEVLSQNWEA